MHNFKWWMKDHPTFAKILMFITLPVWFFPVAFWEITSAIYDLFTEDL